MPETTVPPDPRDPGGLPLLVIREVTEQDRGNSWKLMTGFYLVPGKAANRPPKGVKIVRAKVPTQPPFRDVTQGIPR